MKRFILCALLGATFSLLIPFGAFAGSDVGYTYVSDLTPSSVEVGWSTLAVDSGLDGKTLRIADGKGGFAYYEKGLCAHAASAIEFDISQIPAIRFTSVIGVHDGDNNSTKDSSSVDFEILADGVSIFKSEVFRIGTAGKEIGVDIPVGTTKLTLKTTGAGDGITGDHSAWADAKLLTDSEYAGKFAYLAGKLSEERINIGSTAQISLEGKAFGGNAVDLSDATITYESSDPLTATVSKKGIVTAVSAGSAEITCKAVMDENTVTCRVTVTCLDSRISGKWEALSPDESIKLTANQNSDGSCVFSVTKDGKQAFMPSPLGISTDLCDFSDGLKFVSSDKTVINESYTNMSGKHSSVTNHCNVMTLTFEKGYFRFTVIFRVYDDGFAYRYIVTSSEDGASGDMSVTGENSGFTLPTGTTLWATRVGSLSGSFNYEAGYEKMTAAATKGANLAFPVLCCTPDGIWLQMSEAELYGDAYIGSMLYGAGDCVLKTVPAPVNTGDDVTTTYPFTSPWRLSVVGTLADVVESDLVEKVCDGTTEDYSWVEPGVTAWMWLSEGFNGQRDYDTIIKYIDMAAELGWKYLILDEGWQPNSSKSGKSYDGYFNWFDEMLEHANEKGVGLIVWVKFNDLDTPEEREVLAEWAGKGIKGIKADFFDSEDQGKIALLKAIYEKCAECNLIVNCHGANKPTGERRMWPNVINREAVMGEEYGGMWTTMTTYWPYLRGTLGPTDITPRAYPTSSSTVTRGQQLSTCVIFESGTPCMADSVEAYLNNSAYSFYKNLPSAWDDIHFIQGEVGKYTVLARRSGTTWYIGANTAGTRTPEYTLDFLDDGQYYAVIYNDDGLGGISIETRTVDSGTQLALKLVSGGGYVVKLVKKDATNMITSLGFDSTEVKCELGAALKLSVNVTPASTQLFDYVWTSENPSVAVVVNGTVTGVSVGKTKITVYNSGEPEIVGEITVNVTEASVKLGDGWSAENQSQDASQRYSLSRENIGEISLLTLNGDIGGGLANLISRDAPDGDWEITVKLTGVFEKNTQTAGLIVTNGSRSVAMARRYNASSMFVFYGYSGSYSTNTRKDTRVDEPVSYLKLKKEGNVFTGYFSYDNKNWREMTQSVTDEALASSDGLKIGVYACSGSGADAVEKASFEGFTINGKASAIAVENKAIVSDSVTTVEGGTVISPKSVPAGTDVEALGLPSTVAVTLESGATATASVTWTCGTAYEGKPGEYAFEGALSGVDNYSGIRLTCNVTVEPEGDTDDPVDNPDAFPLKQVLILSGAAVAVLILIIVVASCSKKRKKK